MTMCRTQSSLKGNVIVALISSIFSGIIMLYADFYILNPVNDWSNTILTQVGWSVIIIPILLLGIIGALSFRR